MHGWQYIVGATKLRQGPLKLWMTKCTKEVVVFRLTQFNTIISELGTQLNENN